MVPDSVTDVLGPIAGFTVTPQLPQAKIVPFYQTEEGRIRVDTLRRLFRKDLIADKPFLQGLLALEYPDSLAIAILENERAREYQAEKEPEIRELSRANLQEFFTLGIIDEETWREEMKRLDYSERYIDWFFRAMTVPKE